MHVVDVHANLLSFYASTWEMVINMTTAIQIKQKMNLITVVSLFNCMAHITARTCFFVLNDFIT